MSGFYLIMTTAPEAVDHTTDLDIEVDSFIEGIKLLWPEAEIAIVEKSLTWEWSIYNDLANTVTGHVQGHLGGENRKSEVSINYRIAPDDFAKFVIWYRKFVSASYPLFLFGVGVGSGYLELLTTTNEEEILKFIS